MHYSRVQVNARHVARCTTFATHPLPGLYATLTRPSLAPSPTPHPTPRSATARHVDGGAGKPGRMHRGRGAPARARETQATAHPSRGPEDAPQRARARKATRVAGSTRKAGSEAHGASGMHARQRQPASSPVGTPLMPSSPASRLGPLEHDELADRIHVATPRTRIGRRLHPASECMQTARIVRCLHSAANTPRYPKPDRGGSPYRSGYTFPSVTHM